MYLLRSTFLVLLSVFLLSSCGNGPSDESTASDWLAEQFLVPVDSIGIEMGDSNYVFGLIRAVDFTGSGNIIVGDISRMKLSIFSPEGDFICSGGSQGEGPGEYSAPTGISPGPSGGILVSDRMGGKLIFYDSLLEYSHELTGFIPNPPEDPCMLDDGSLVGTRFIFDQNRGNLTNTLHRWEARETQPSVTYCSRSGEFDRQDPREVFRRTSIVYCVLHDGRVVTSPLSPDEYSITCFTMEGEVDWEVHVPYEKTARPDDMIEIEREMTRAAMRRSGRDPSFADQMEFINWADAITGLQTDGSRIWARRGGSLVPFFDIFSSEGEYLYSCSVPSMPFGTSVAFVISENGFLGYMANPDDYSKVFVLEVIDNSDAVSPEQSSE